MNQRFPSEDKSSVLFVDLGQGFFAARGGKITEPFRQALTEHALTTYNGDDAELQLGDLQEVMLHDTAMSWIRDREAATRPVEAWKETPSEVASRLRAICKDINNTFDVEGLCRALPKGLQMLEVAECDKIKP